MYIYLLTVFIASSIAVVTHDDERRYQGLIVTLCFCLVVALMMFLGMRSSWVTPDTIWYLGYINSGYTILGDFEPLSSLFFDLLSVFKLGDRANILIMLLFPYALIVFSIVKKYSLYKSLLALVFVSLSFTYFDLLTNVTRQAFGVSLMFFGVSFYLKDGVKYKLVGWLFVSTLFHYSLIIPFLIVFFLFLSDLKDRRVLRVLCFIVCVLSVGIFFDFYVSKYFIDGLLYFSKVFGLPVKVTHSFSSYSVVTETSFSSWNFNAKIIQIFFISIALFSVLMISGRVNDLELSLCYLFVSLLLVYVVMADQSRSIRYWYLASSLSPFIFISTIESYKAYSRILISLVFIVLILYYTKRVSVLEYSFL